MNGPGAFAGGGQKASAPADISIIGVLRVAHTLSYDRVTNSVGRSGCLRRDGGSNSETVSNNDVSGL
ncbi:hypothetical protein T265_00651 [Opisthorchis viverrini]|uniref:Uncharacterized protein n=1 Tax=Opisthorchis viverrini TaxID=6198 RepID=A0A075A2E5_OPIVI|nr:hypothetical protein T265_00651 [Opisthorchis viverrini]KER33541.1 hypothetical protein T265_00651 [Opisthorchis viverrini]